MRLRYTNTALRQIEDVLSDIAVHSLQGAAGLRERILEAAALIRDHPYAAQATNRRDVRRVVLTPYPYALFYRVTADEVVIMRLRHAARRPLSQAGQS